jgi:ABC-2 type transport system ATP-binding protein
VTAPASLPAIRFASLTKRYGAVQALRGIDLAVPRGEVYGFLGPNGAGKSTAIRVLLDLIRPTDGRAEALGLDSRRDGVALRRRIGYLPGDFRPEPRMTAQELFDLVAAMRGGAVDLRYRGELTERLLLDPARRIGDLSRGNRQKVGLVLVFMSRPELLVLDEPTSGLDPLMQETVQALLRETVADGRSVFFSSHVLSEVQQVCTRVAMLRAGEIVDEFDLAERRRLAPEHLTVEFAAPPPPDAFGGLPGVRVAEAAGSTVQFELSDSADALVKRLAAFTVLRLAPHEVTLEEMFRSYYDTDGSRPAGSPPAPGADDGRERGDADLP